MEKIIYLDSASTTYVNSEVLREMMPVFNMQYGNASSLHKIGREATNLIDIARTRIAKTLNVKPSEIYFTSGGTEANNWAILGLARANRDKGNHIITSKIEHHSVLEACKQLEKEGFEVTYLDVDDKGVVKLTELMHYITNNTILVSIMAANNEVGTIQHLKAIAQTVKERPNCIFHCDCVQAYSHIAINPYEIGIDALSISSHKIYGPKGAGALFLKKGIKIDNLMLGGNQESGKRGGTVNVPSIVGFGKAAEIAIRDMRATNEKLKFLRDYLYTEIVKNIPGVHLNGHPYQRLPQILNISFECIEGESILLMLDMENICISTGSACTTGSLEPSHVLEAMGVSKELSNSAIRFSISKNNTKQDIDEVVLKLKKIVEKLRTISPLQLKGEK